MSPVEAPTKDPDSIRLMASALDKVLDHLPEKIERTDDVRRDVALFIVDQFRLGEHDPERLSDLALAMLCPTGDEAKDDEPKGDELVTVTDGNDLAPKE